jgi:hypothetical protein
VGLPPISVACPQTTPFPAGAFPALDRPSLPFGLTVPHDVESNAAAASAKGARGKKWGIDFIRFAGNFLRLRMKTHDEAIHSGRNGFQIAESVVRTLQLYEKLCVLRTEPNSDLFADRNQKSAPSVRKDSSPPES